MKSSSVGRKLVMSVSGMFLVLFLTLHLVINLTSLISRKAYEAACRFMDENILIQIMVPALALGFVVHITYAIILTLRNRKARLVDYEVKGQMNVSWASQNMFVLGLIVLGFLIIHLCNFWTKMQLQHFLGNEGGNPYDLVKSLFNNWFYVIIYIVWITALFFHISHGFWSMFQSMGITNSKWIPRIRTIGILYSHLIMLGFIAIPVYFFLGFGDV
jgi:succinate dehydrogenase / fumarate reductase cytochrome b subunit